MSGRCQPCTMPKPSVTAHPYSKRYFARQCPIGKFGATADRGKFAAYVRKEDRVLDFGCGGAFMLENLDCAGRVGIDINPAARCEAQARGIEMHADLSEVPEESVDLVISDNALEHVDLPLAVLKEVYRVLKPRGRLVAVVPCEGILTRDLGPADLDHHLHSWSPGALANLVRSAGLAVDESRAFIHRWPPKPQRLQRLLGWRGFEAACRLWGSLSLLKVTQVRVIAHK